MPLTQRMATANQIFNVQIAGKHKNKTKKYYENEIKENDLKAPETKYKKIKMKEE